MELFSPSSKNKKNQPHKKILTFREMELSGSNINKFQETETPKKNPYISGNGKPKKDFYILGNANFQLKFEKQKIPPRENGTF